MELQRIMRLHCFGIITAETVLDGRAPGSQAENGENKPQPVALGESGLLDAFGLAE